MGYFTEDITTFRLSVIGKHNLYIFRFSDEYSPSFSTMIGNKAVSISSRLQNIEKTTLLLKDFLGRKPPNKGTILFVFNDKKEANTFLKSFQGRLRLYNDWKNKLENAQIPPVDETLSSGITFIIPKDKEYSLALGVISNLIANGLVNQAIEENKLN